MRGSAGLRLTGPAWNRPPACAFAGKNAYCTLSGPALLDFSSIKRLVSNTMPRSASIRYDVPTTWPHLASDPYVVNATQPIQ